MLFFIIKINYLHILFNSYLKMSQIWPQWRIQGGAPGGGGWHPLFLDQTKARSAENIFLTQPPYSQGLDDPSPPDLKVCIPPLAPATK